MSNPLSEILISQKTATWTAGSSISVWFAAAWGWIDKNFELLDISAFASFLLVLVLIVSHFCDNIRKNREHQSIMRERELRIELLRKELNEKDGLH